MTQNAWVYDVVHFFGDTSLQLGVHRRIYVLKRFSYSYRHFVMRKALALRTSSQHN